MHAKQAQDGDGAQSVQSLLVLGRDAAVSHTLKYSWCLHRAELCVEGNTGVLVVADPPHVQSLSWGDGSHRHAPAALPAGRNISTKSEFRAVLVVTETVLRGWVFQDPIAAQLAGKSSFNVH